MNCPKCGGEATVIDTRITGPVKRRRRGCAVCAYRFSTVEAPVKGRETDLRKHVNLASFLTDTELLTELATRLRRLS